MKKILYLVSTLKNSGPTNQLYNIIKNLDPDEFEPHLVTLSPEPEDTKIQDFKCLGMSIRSMSFSRLSGVFFAKRKLKKIINEISPDIIHSQGLRSDVLSSKLESGIPRVSTIRNFPQYDYAMTYGNLVGKVMTWRHSHAMKGVEVCVGVSDAVTKNLIDYVGISKAVCISNGVDTELYFPVLDQEKSDLRMSLGLDKGRETWISSGHLSDRKDPISLIDAWSDVFANDETKQLVFIGDGPLRAECDRLAESFPNVFVFGRVSNVSDYLKASDYFVSASKSEGLPNSVLEAMACGLPVLLSDIPPHREILEKGDNAGFLYSFGKKEALKSGFLRLVDCDRTAKSEAALSLVLDNLSANKMSKSYQQIYINLLNGNG